MNSSAMMMMDRDLLPSFTQWGIWSKAAPRISELRCVLCRAAISWLGSEEIEVGCRVKRYAEVEVKAARTVRVCNVIYSFPAETKLRSTVIPVFLAGRACQACDRLAQPARGRRLPFIDVSSLVILTPKPAQLSAGAAGTRLAAGSGTRQ